MVEATEKLDIPQDVHLAGQLSHTCLLLFPIMAVPEQTPLLSTVTHVPLSEYWLLAQMIQSLEVPPVHVSQLAEHVAHAVPLLKLPSGQTVPDDVVCSGASHFVRSVESCVNPDLHVIQIPLLSSQSVHPSWHAEQSPFESRKNPLAHFAHAVPLSAVVHPALHVH